MVSRFQEGLDRQRAVAAVEHQLARSRAARIREARENAARLAIAEAAVKVAQDAAATAQAAAAAAQSDIDNAGDTIASNTANATSNSAAISINASAITLKQDTVTLLTSLIAAGIARDDMWVGGGDTSVAKITGTTSYGRSLLSTASAAALLTAIGAQPAGKIQVFKAAGTSTASIQNLTVDLAWAAPEITHDDVSVSGVDITFATAGTYTIDCTAKAAGTNRVEMILQLYEDPGEGYAAKTNDIVSDYIMRDSDQNTGAVTLSTAIAVGAGTKIKVDCHGDADGTVSLVTAGTNMRIMGPF